MQVRIGIVRRLGPATLALVLGGAIGAPAHAEKYGGVEIGAKGVKASAIDVDPAIPSLQVLELPKQTVDVTIARLRGKKFEEVLIDDVAAVVADFAAALEKELGVPKSN